MEPAAEEVAPEAADPSAPEAVEPASEEPAAPEVPQPSEGAVLTEEPVEPEAAAPAEQVRALLHGPLCCPGASVSILAGAPKG